MISVVMATYNGETYLREQFESILNQSRKPNEIIINDDASTDNTISIINDIMKISEIPILIQINKKRLGYARNFRNAICRATGNIIFLSDQDDVWLENKIELCMEAFEERQEILALSTGYYLTDSTLRRRRPSSVLKTGKLMKVPWKRFIRHPKYPGMAMAFRKTVWAELDAMQWHKDVAHDWMINQYAASLDGMYLLENRLVLYRQHGGNAAGVITGRKKGDMLSARIKLIHGLIEGMKIIRSTDSKKIDYLRKMILFQKKRKELFCCGKTFQLLVYEVFKIKYISLRSILGDLYVNIRSRGGNRCAV